MWNPIPAQPEVQRQSTGCAPVVLNVGRGRNVVPMSSALQCGFVVLLRVAEKEIGEVTSAVYSFRIAPRRRSERAIKGKSTLGCRKIILDLFVDSPACAKPELVSSLGPGDIVPNLIVIGCVNPGLP